MKLALFLGISFLARAQLTLVTCDGTPAATVGATYNFGTSPAGTPQNVHFCAQNNGGSAVTVSTISVAGAGFSVSAVNGTLPYPIAPANFLEFSVTFSVPQTSVLGTYSASLLLTAQPGPAINVVLLATPISGPTVTIFSPCTPGSGNTIAFGTLENGSLHLCNVLVQNQGAQPLTISAISASGNFQAVSVPALPTTLAPNGAGISFAIETTPACGTGAISGTLNVASGGAAFNYALTASGADPPLPKPALAIDGTTFTSAQQHLLSMSLTAPAVCAAKGNVNLAFAPLKNVPAAGDASIVFLAGSTRSLPFSVSAGSTAVSINGQSSAAFQTGTTAGTITFTVSGYPLAGDPTFSISVPAAPVTIETAAASNQRTGELDIEVVGFDNTYSTGPMSFTFFDAKGNQIGGAIAADFTQSFAAYYATQNAGSSFLIRVSFPVQGNASQVATVQATLTNAAGQAQTGSLTFQ